jgi:hypothetical protein
VHRDIRKAPERVCFVSQEVRRDEGIFIRPNDLPAERTMSPAGLDPNGSGPRVLVGPHQLPIACQTAQAGQQCMPLAAGRKPDPRRVLLIAILTGGWNGSTCIAVVAVQRDGTELLCGTSDFKFFYLDDGALIRGLYPCPQDSCFKCERLKIDSKGAGGPGELAPSLLSIGDRGDQCTSNKKRDQAHMTSKGICQKRVAQRNSTPDGGLASAAAARRVTTNLPFLWNGRAVGAALVTWLPQRYPAGERVAPKSE